MAEIGNVTSYKIKRKSKAIKNFTKVKADCLWFIQQNFYEQWLTSLLLCFVAGRTRKLQTSSQNLKNSIADQAYI